jgi:hypothetical protein
MRATLSVDLLIKMPVEDACKLAWDWGAREHRKDPGVFEGCPITELHSEGIDALNYIAEIERRGDVEEECIRNLQEHASAIVRGCRLLLGVPE